MYLISDHHPAIIERTVFNQVQQELARRKSKRKISDKTITEQGKYSSKYVLSELLICGNCGSPYKRVTWTAQGKKRLVWRCISRLEHGKKYCQNSPTMTEESLHKAILRACNEYFSCSDDIKKILKSNIGTILECQNNDDILSIENRLLELDTARTELVTLIATGGCDEDKMDSEYEKIFVEETSLKQQLDNLKSQRQVSDDTQQKLIA